MPDIKTFNGIASANVKTIRGVAIASIKTFNGNAVVNGPSGPPSAVSATAVGTVENASNGKLDLVWTNGDAAAQTRIYNGGTLLATANAAATTYSVTTLTSNTSYTLTVKHLKASVESAGSNFSSATTYVEAGANNSYYCSGCTRRQSYANGNNGTTDNAVNYYYQDCGSGYSCCRPADELLETYCDGGNTNYHQVYSNGQCGTYDNISYDDCINCTCYANCPSLGMNHGTWKALFPFPNQQCAYYSTHLVSGYCNNGNIEGMNWSASASCCDGSGCFYV